MPAVPEPAANPPAPSPTVSALSNLRLVRYAPGWGHTPADFARALAAATPVPLKSTTHPVTGEKYVSVCRATLSIAPPSKRAKEQGRATESASVVVKINPLPTLGKRLRSLLKGTKHHRQWRGYERLYRAGVLAAKPLALLRATTPEGEAEVLLLEHVEGQTLLEILATRATGTPLPKRLRAVLSAAIVAHESHRLWNRDPKPSNVVLTQPPGKPLACAFIDTVGIERRSPRHAAEDHGFLRQFLKLLLLETRGSGISAPPKFAAKLATFVIFESDNPGWKRKPGFDLTKARKKAKRQASKLVRQIEQEIAGRDPTPVDSPLPPTARP